MEPARYGETIHFSDWLHVPDEGAELHGACTCQRALSAVIVTVRVISSCILLLVRARAAGVPTGRVKRICCCCCCCCFYRRRCCCLCGAKPVESRLGSQGFGGFLLQPAWRRGRREREEEREGGKWDAAQRSLSAHLFFGGKRQRGTLARSAVRSLAPAGKFGWPALTWVMGAGQV